MPKMLIAASPVEVEAKAEEAGFTQAVHDAALQLFHQLTDRLGQAAIALAIPHEGWPNHRFYFGHPDAIEGVTGGLRHRTDMLDVSQGVPADRPAGTPAGLYVIAVSGEHRAVLVGHENHDGLVAGA